MEEPNNYNNFDDDYKDSIKSSVSNGTYFKDAFDWYCVKYLKSIVDRTFFIFLSIMGIIIIYCVVKIVTSILPLKEDIFIAIREKDLTKYQTTIHDLSKSKEAKSTDESILEYLLCNYVKERESHNYKSANIEDVNVKLKKIENNSSADVFNEFKYFMSAEYENGPYYYFGQNVETSIKIDSFKFIRAERTKMIDKIIDYFNVRLMPIKAEVFYTLNTKIGDKVTSERKKAILSFKFTGIEYDEETGKYLPVKFVVTNYENYSLN